MQYLCRIGTEGVEMDHDKRINTDPSVAEHYLRISEEDKNIETVRAVIRLHNLVLYTILFQVR